MAKKKPAAKRAKPVSSVKIENAGYRDPIQEWLRDAITDKNSTGVSVNTRSLLGYAPAWSCVNKIAGHVGYLPVHLFERDVKNPKKITQLLNSIPYYAIASEPNAWMTAQTFKETITSDALIHGNGRAYIVFNGNNVASEFIPLPGDKTKTFLVKFSEDNQDMEGSTAESVAYQGGWEKWHVTTLSNGKKFYMPDYKVLHIPGLSYDGIQGYSVLELAKQSLGLGMTAERAALKHFSNGGKPSFFVKAPPGTLTKKEDAEEFISTFRKEHAGEDNEGKIGLLRGGTDIATVQQTARDSQQNEQRLFQRQETALLFAVEQILGDDSSVSYRSLEEKNRAYITNCLNRWLNKWEQELARKTLTVAQRRSMRYYYRFDDWELTRGTMAERFQAYQIARQAEILNSNECREYEELEPREGGDSYANPAINPTPSPSAPSNAARSAIANRVRHIVGVEKKRLLAISEHPERFIESVAKFYKSWKDTIENVVKETGGDCSLAENWADSSRERIIEASGKATKENLKSAIEAELATWQVRIEELIDSIKEVACYV